MDKLLLLTKNDIITVMYELRKLPADTLALEVILGKTEQRITKHLGYTKTLFSRN